MKGKIDNQRLQQISYLVEKNLPPIISPEVLATMLGINSGLVWSFLYRQNKHYRKFEIKKGNGVREITAPKVALKVVQKWISLHIERAFTPPDFVFGFVRGRSHIDGAKFHAGAAWAYSVDITSFFPSTPETMVINAFHALGYDLVPATLLARLCCYQGVLAQGAPTSPVISNVCFRDMDERMFEIARGLECKFSRYADDLTFSGNGTIPDRLPELVHAAFAETPWKLSPQKELQQPVKGRIKIHGMLIKEDGVRLTKGYRNRVRAYAHIIERDGVAAHNFSKMRGHLEYASHVSNLTGSPSGVSEKNRNWREAARRNLSSESPDVAVDAASQSRSLLQIIRDLTKL